MPEQEKLNFHSISIDDRNWINEKLKEDHLDACEYTFANNFIWAKVYDVQVGSAYGCGVIRYREQEHFQYSFPFGNGDKQSMIGHLKKICAVHGHGLKIAPITEEGRLKLLEWFPGEFEISADRDDFDYVYTVEKLSSLKGKKLHAKRNHITRFMDDGDWQYEPMTVEHIPECRRMAKEWIALRAEKWNDEMEQEIAVLEVAFSNFSELGLYGGVLYKSGELVAFTIGEPLNKDTFVVHFEKAFPDLQGAYPMINQQFVLHEAQDFMYVNREEDTGDPGLRKAKMSYYPDILLRKYSAAESHLVFANETEWESVIEIWNRCFGDDRAYIELYLKNRFESENMYVIYENNRPVSMASLLPVQVTINGKKENARYVYAVATLPEYRNKGYASEIIKHAARKYNEPLILQPADRDLQEYYEKQGFADAFGESPCWIYAGRCTGTADIQLLPTDGSNLRAAEEMDVEDKLDILGSWIVSDADEKEYKAVRDQFFEGEGYVEWGEKAIAYAIKENQFCGGRTLLLTKGIETEKTKKAVLMYRIEKDSLHIIETTLDDDELHNILPELLEYAGTTWAFERNMGGMVLLPERLKDWDCREGYLGLTLA
ncbi:MAG: GNAT family N-acetyltransferase [Lachnospiraceae bacterium]|nr:GNAT family N-acetyltransferase [Lachnospiraceae bacterium]